MCELAAVVDDEEMVEKTTYIIQVQTSDVRGGSQEFKLNYTRIYLRTYVFLFLEYLLLKYLQKTCHLLTTHE